MKWIQLPITALFSVSMYFLNAEATDISYIYIKNIVTRTQIP